MSIDYYSEEVFSLPADEVVARAAADGATWVLLSYLQQWCSSRSFPPKGVSLLVEVYRSLGCEVNCWFLSEKYLRDRQHGYGPQSGKSLVPGLKLATPIVEVASRFVLPNADSLWAERNLVLETLRQKPQSLAAWLHLVEQDTILEELLEAVWTLFIVKMNAPASAGVFAALSDEVEMIRIYGTSGSFWSFVGESDLLLKVRQILADEKTDEEIAHSIRSLFGSSFSISLDRDNLLQPVGWLS